MIQPEKPKKSDAKEISKLLKKDKIHLLPRTEKEIAKNIKNFLVIRSEGKIVACASFENYARKIAEIRSLMVLPEYRGNGYSKLLIKSLLERAKKGQEVFVVTSKADYFKKLGFATVMGEKQFLFLTK
ncbi:MAG: GNAT family N-acetyltransferase [archaeon]